MLLGMAERFIATDLKSVNCQRFGGSNPSPSTNSGAGTNNEFSMFVPAPLWISNILNTHFLSLKIQANTLGNA